jgi:translation elongation factor EF-1alpha
MTEQKPEAVEGRKVGEISHYFSKISVGIIELAGPLKVGDSIRIKGHTTDVTQTVDSMQVEHQNVAEAKAGDSVGVKVTEHVRVGDTVYVV